MRGFDRETFIGSKWGPNEHLAIVGVSEYEKGRPDISAYLTCDVCSSDSELYGDGIFKMNRGSLLAGSIPCGCSIAPKWSDAQHRVRVRRFSEVRGFEVLGFNVDILRSDSRVKLRCLSDGHEWDMALSKLYFGRGCPQCRVNRAVVSEEDNIARFKSSGRYPEGSVFKRLDIPTRKWYYRCPVCAEDEYTKAGLCTGEFTVSAASLYNGFVACRCSENVFLPKELCEWKIGQVCGGMVKFAGWVGGVAEGIGTSRKNIVIECPTHGEQKVSYPMLSTSGSCCPLCKTGGGFKQHLPGYVYVLKASTQDLSKGFTGYGISNYRSKRILTHKNNLSKKCLEIQDVEVFAVGGSEALNIENKIRERFPVDSQPIVGFKREATFTHLYDEVVAFVKSLLPVQEPALV